MAYSLSQLKLRHKSSSWIFIREILLQNGERVTGRHNPDTDGLVQDCSNSSALAMELLQSYTKHAIVLKGYKNGDMESVSISINTLRPRQNGRHFASDIFKCIFLNENVWILFKICLTFVPKGPINNILALVQIMAWRSPGDNPLSEPLMVSLLMHICVMRPQWVKISYCEILWSLKAARLVVMMIVSLWNLTDVSAAVLSRRLSNNRAVRQL